MLAGISLRRRVILICLNWDKGASIETATMQGIGDLFSTKTKEVDETVREKGENAKEFVKSGVDNTGQAMAQSKDDVVKVASEAVTATNQFVDEKRNKVEDGVYQTAPSADNKAKEAGEYLSNKKEQVQQGFHDSTQYVQNKAKDAGQYVADKAHQGKQGVVDSGQYVQNKAKDAGQYVADMAHQGKQGVVDSTHYMQDKARAAGQYVADKV